MLERTDAPSAPVILPLRLKIVALTIVVALAADCIVLVDSPLVFGDTSVPAVYLRLALSMLLNAAGLAGVMTIIRCCETAVWQNVMRRLSSYCDSPPAAGGE